MGLNGQLRIFECSDVAADCFGVTLGYQGAGSSAPYVDQFITMYQTTSGGLATTSATTLATRVLMGKQRNVFGNYLVYNENLQQVTIDKFTSNGLGVDLTYTTTAETAVQLLGAHEFYWWGYGSQLLAKLSDGISFKMFRFASDFDTVAVTASPTDLLIIEQELKNLWHVPDKTIVPPVFVQDVGVFFIVDSSSAGWLYFYKWNSVSNYFELDTRVNVVSATATGWETETTLIRTIDGVIFKESSQSDIYYYETLTYTWTATLLTMNYASFTAYMGTIDWTSFIMRQTRDEPLTYDTAETEAPRFVGFMNDDYIYVLSYAASVLTVTDSIAMPCNTNQVSAGCDTDRAFITLSPTYFDIGINYIAVLSPIDCSAQYQSSAITNASVRYYALDTVWEIDANYNGYVDSTEWDVNDDGVIDSLDYTAVDWALGWTCMDVPTSFNW